MSKMFVVALMVFCHIVDDYRLQGILASMKQKSWWKENAPEGLYDKDYIAALAMHSFSWAFMIMLPIAAYMKFNPPVDFFIMLLVNALFHGIMDNAKANLRTVNLIQDQIFHIFQIVITAFCLL